MPSSFQKILSEAAELVRTGEYDAALVMLEAIARRETPDGDLYYALAYCYYKKLDFNTAAAFATAARDAGNPVADSLLAKIGRKRAAYGTQAAKPPVTPPSPASSATVADTTIPAPPPQQTPECVFASVRQHRIRVPWHCHGLVGSCDSLDYLILLVCSGRNSLGDACGWIPGDFVRG